MKRTNESRRGALSEKRSPSERKQSTWRLPLMMLSLITLLTGGSVVSRTLIKVGAAAQKGTDPIISESAARQIQALLDEKESRTPAQQKLDSQLVYAIKQRRGDALFAAVPTLETGVAIDQQGKTTVDITAKIGGSLIEDLAAAGAGLSYIYPQYNSIRATVALDQLENIAALSQVIFIMPKQEGQVWRTAEPSPAASTTAFRSGLAPDFAERASRVRSRLMDALAKTGQQPDVGSVNSQGDTCHKANTARTTFGANGAGVRIGVLSNGVTSLAASQALGDLGPVTVLPGQVGTGDEGTAMLEIVHDLAPGADLFYATANPIIAAFAQNIRDLRSAGCDIIVDDVFYFVETPFQDGQAPSVVSNTNGGLVIQAVKDVTAAGAMYFSSAGNQGNLTDNTSSCYQGDFVDGGTLIGAIGGTVHDFDPTVAVAQSDLIQTGSGNPIDLYWSDPLGGAANDYDLFVFNNALTAVVASSTNVQNGTQDPFEQTAGATNVTNNRVVVLKKTGSSDRFFHITINANGVGRLGTATEGTTKGHSIALEAYSCGATPAAPPGPFPNPFSAVNVSETFSSDGPRRIFFLENGTAITPGNFSSTGGTLRQKPDITAADRVSVTGVGGFPTTFSGTSAAAPHAAAIAGLVKSGFPPLTNAQIRTLLTNTAIDIETAGVDRTTGVGIIMPFEAMQSNGAIASANFEAGTITATENGGNGNTFIEPGEAGTLSVQLTNTGVANATGITAVLSTATPNVNITTSASAYPNLATSASATNTTPFGFVLNGVAPCDLKIDFKLTVTYTGGNSPKVSKFFVQTGRPPVMVSTTIDASAPPASTDYTAVTGVQINRVTRDGRASTCNLPKVACPGITAATSPRFDAYTFSTCSTGAATRCLTVTLTTPCPTVVGGTQLFAAAYLGTYVPASICTNYLADAGSSPAANGTVSFTFNVASNTTFVVVVSEVPGTATNCTYTLTVSGLCLACPTAAKVDNLNATGFDDGRVLVQWQSSQEVDNLGFNVYREQNGQRVRINSQIVAGSSLTTGASNSLLAGHSYQWGDTPPALSGKTRYWLEEVDLNGSSSWTGPVEVRRSRAKRSAHQERNAALLSSLVVSGATISNGAGSGRPDTVARLTAVTAATAETQSSIASQPAVKLGVSREGWYRVSQAQLAAAGLDPKTDPRNLQMFVDGSEIPIAVRSGTGGYTVEFYGIGLDTQATNTRVYWLIGGSQPGKRINTVTGNPGLGGVQGGFGYTVERKERSIYFSSLRNGDAENFFGPTVTRSPVDQTLTLRHLASASGADATVEVALQGVNFAPHEVQVLVNGDSIGSVTFAGQARGGRRLPISQSKLREGENVVRLVAQGGETDVSLLASIRITYQHAFTADDNVLMFGAAARQPVTVDGFSNSAIRMMDVTDPNAVQEVAGSVKPGKSGYSISASVPGVGQRTLLAFSDSGAMGPASIKHNEPSSLRQSSNGADLIILTRRDFFASVAPLQALRQSQGLSVALVDVEDVYDEFSFGNKSPQAVKDFMLFARSNWSRAPRFALIVGDGSYDPRNYLGFGDNDVVTTKLLDTQSMETASDEWFVDANDDGVGELAIGRLPVRTAAEASRLISKIVSYDGSTGLGSLLLVSDANDGYNFDAATEELRRLVPDGLRVEQVNRGQLDPAAAKTLLIDAINRGQKIVNYTGHGNASQWRGSILTSEDAAALSNGSRLSLFVSMTCLNGYFQDASVDSLAEALLKAERGGAVAVWTSSGMTEPGAQASLDQEMFRLLFGASSTRVPALTLGEAITRAKSSTPSGDVRRTWVLLGDPSMKLK